MIIISYNSKDLTLGCIGTALDSSKRSLNKIIVVDNASDDGSVEAIAAEFPYVEIIENKKNCGYAAAVNAGAKLATSEFLIVSNSDVRYLNNSIAYLVKFLADNPDVAVAGPQQLYPDGAWQRSYGDFPGAICGLKELFYCSTLKRAVLSRYNKSLGLDKNVKYPDYIDGAVMCVRKSDFDLIGGFDEDYFFYTEETDFCYRLKNIGKLAAFVPQSNVIHYRGMGRGDVISCESAKMLVESKLKFCSKHLSALETYVYAMCEIVHSVVNIMFLNVVQNLLNENTKYPSKIENNRNLLSCWMKAF